MKPLLFFKQLLFALPVLSLGWFSAKAQVTELGTWNTLMSRAATQDRDHFDPVTGEQLPYRLFLPENFDPSQKYPVVLALHGNGSRSCDNTTQINNEYSGWMQSAIQQEYPSIVIVPQSKSGWAVGQFSGYDFTEIPENDYMKALQHLMERFYEKDFVDRQRIYVYGASKGGMGTWDFALRNNDIVAAALPMMGAGDPSEAARLVDVPLWANVGALDRAFYASTLNMFNGVALASGNPGDVIPINVPPVNTTGDKNHRVNYSTNNDTTRLSIYPDLGHSTSSLAWQDVEMINWTFTQVNTSRSRPISANTPPVFTSNPLVLDVAVIDQNYGELLYRECDVNQDGIIDLGTDGMGADSREYLGKGYGFLLSDFALDVDKDPLFYEIVAGPAWLTLDMTGELTGIPSASDVGVNTWTVKVWDGRGGVDEITLQIEVAVDTFPPEAPSGLIGIPGNGQVSIAWDLNGEEDMVNGGTYKVYRSELSGQFDELNPLATGLPVSYYLDLTALNDTTYFYRVKAVDLNGNQSSGSEQISMTPGENAGPTRSFFVHETFDYAVGDFALHEAVPPAETGLGNGWLASRVDVGAGNLSAPAGYGPAPSGNHFSYDQPRWNRASVPLAEENRIDFNQPGVVYVSYLGRVTGRRLHIDFILDDLTSIAAVGFISGRKLSINFRGTTNQSAEDYPVNEVVLVVVRIETNLAGLDVISASFFTDSVGDEPEVWQVTVEQDVAFVAERIAVWSTLAAGQLAQFDELRMGNTFDSVVKAGPVLAPPTQLNAAPRDNSVFLSWNHELPLGRTFQIFRRSLTGTYPPTPLASGISSTNYLDETAVNDEAYLYRVVAVEGADVFSEPSEEVLVIPATSDNYSPVFNSTTLVKPNATAGLAYAESIADDALDIDTTQLYFFKRGGPGWLSVALDGTLSGTPGVSDIGLNEFTVEVLGAGGGDVVPMQITVEGVQDTTPPAAPIGLSAVAADGDVVLNWTANTEPDLASYAIYRRVADGSYGASALVAGLIANGFTDQNVSTGMTYVYKLRAIDQSGNFAESQEVSVALIPPPFFEGVFEPFNYSAGVFQGQTPPSGYGLSGTWTGNEFEVGSGSLTAPDGYTLTPTGNHIYDTADNWGTTYIGLDAASQIDFNLDQVVYISYLYRQNNPGQGLFELKNGNTRVAIVGKPSSSRNLSVELGGVRDFTGTEFPHDTDMLIVVRVQTRVVGNDTISASFYTTSVGEEPASWDVTASAEMADTIDRVGFYVVTAPETFVYFDEIRIGSSFESVVRAPAASLAAPSELMVTASADDNVQLVWVDNSSDETGFIVQRSLNSSGPYSAVATPAANAVAHSDVGLTPGTSYYYQVVATHSTGDSAPSNTAQATTWTEQQQYFADYGLPHDADYLIDHDGDGLNSGDEFTAGTDPDSANSVFRITTEDVAGERRLHSPLVAGKYYRLKWRASLTEGDWTPVADHEGILSSDGTPLDFVVTEMGSYCLEVSTTAF